MVEAVVEAAHSKEKKRSLGKVLLLSVNVLLCITVCLPYSMLEPIRAKLVAAFQSERLELDQHWMKRMVRQLEAVEVELSVELGHTEITLQSLLDLQTGDIIRLDQDSDSEIVVRVEGIHKFMGLPRVMKQKKAVEITTRILPPEEDEDE